MIRIAPSILSADFLNLGQDIEMLNQSEADWIHCDVMDGNFVPNYSFGFPVLSAVNQVAKKPLDVHLMGVQPERYLQDFKNAGAATLTLHLEALQHPHRTLSAIRELGMQAGLALNPGTPVSLVKHLLELTDLVLIMSVNPGFGGQKFIDFTYEKVSELKNMILKAGVNTLIEVDGGVGVGNAAKLTQAGADVLVAGNAVFKTPDPIKTIAALKKSLQN